MKKQNSIYKYIIVRDLPFSMISNTINRAQIEMEDKVDHFKATFEEGNTTYYKQKVFDLIIEYLEKEK